MWPAPLAAQAAQAAQIHGAAAAKAAQTAQVHVQAAQAANALAQQAAEAHIRSLHGSTDHCLSARPREQIPVPASPKPASMPSPVHSVQSTVQYSPHLQSSLSASSPYSPPSQYVTVRQYSSTSVQLPTPQGVPCSTAPRRSHPSAITQMRPVEPQLPSTLGERKLSQEHPLMQKPPLEGRPPLLQEKRVPELPKRRSRAEHTSIQDSSNFSSVQTKTPERLVAEIVEDTIAPVTLSDLEVAACPIETLKAVPVKSEAPAPLDPATLPATLLLSREVLAEPGAEAMDTPVFNAVPMSLDFDTSDAKASEKDTEEADNKDSTDTSEALDPSHVAAAASEALRRAVEQQQPPALREALAEAVAAGSGWELIEWAHDKCRELEHEAWKKDMQKASMNALQRLLDQPKVSADALSDACEQAWQAGVQAEALESAREECGRRRLRQAAEEALLSMLAERSCCSTDFAERLQQALKQAEKAVISSDLMSYAAGRLEELHDQARRQEITAQASEELSAFSPNTAAEMLPAMKTALAAGVSREVLDKAWEKKVNLEIHEWQAQKTKLSKRRPSVAVLQDLEDAPVVAAPSEEEVALAWRPKESASGSSCSESFVSRGDPEIQGRWTVPPRLPSVDRATPPRTPPRSVMVTEEVEARDFRSNELRPHVVRSASGPRAASVGHRYSPSPRPKPEDLPCYGLDAELKAKAAAKYSHSAEEAAANWVQAVTGHHFQIDFGTTLRSGAILCDLVNCIRPGSISKVNAPGMPFKERENICNFLRACRSFGVQEYALFSTDDLYEEKNLMSVVNCLHALGGAVQRSVPQFPGPHLGVIDTSNTKRDFKRDLGPVSQTGGLRGPLERSHLDVVSNANVRVGGC